MPPRAASKAGASKTSSKKTTRPSVKATEVTTRKGRTTTVTKTRVPAASKRPAARKKAAVPSSKQTGAKPKAKKGLQSKETQRLNEAAILIQKHVRGFLERQTAQRAARRRQEYEAEMEKIEREAWVAWVKRQQAEDEQRYQKERERKQQEKMLKKKQVDMREAAFDDDADKLMKLLADPAVAVDAPDGNGDTALSEAAAAGSIEAINLLLTRGADVNSRGRFDRTPLYRAAFAGHAAAVVRLLEAGADPRMYDNEGMPASEVAANAECREVLETWDIAKTDVLLKHVAEKREQAQLQEQAQRQEKLTSLGQQVEDARKDDSAKQRILLKAREELEKRIVEHDKVVVKGDERLLEVTLQMVHDSEAAVIEAQLAAEASRIKVRELNHKYRQQESDIQRENGDDDMEEMAKCSIRELDDVLMRDVGNVIANDGRWPLLMDASKQVATFLRYRDTNYINVCSPYETEPDRLRLAILGSLRYAKPLVLDMLDVDSLDLLQDRLDAIRPGLLSALLSKQIMNEQYYTELIKSEDGDAYDPVKFDSTRIQEHFKMFLLTTALYPDPQMFLQLYPLVVIPSDPS
eukprot:TRINITY_DN11580_c0_g1_i16.p1 TRINITY_DN11580_c0_g1~~TRINITY_DN11580_c0_g1_i16.p1  ORF type:complete len:590 (+),score=130.91 TRINITY_DN11580_c0_g1_i16:38-1771(+)